MACLANENREVWGRVKRGMPALRSILVILAGCQLLSLPVVSRSEQLKAEETAKKDLESVKKESDTTEKNVVEPFNPETVVAPLRALVAAAAPVAVRRPVRAKNGEVLIQAAAQNEAMIQQFVQQLRPVMTSELAFVRLICDDLTPNQRKKIKAAAVAGLKEAAKASVSRQNGQPVRVVAGVVGRSRSSNEPRTIIRDAISNSIKEVASEELMTRYSTAATKRIERRKQTAILCVSARLDDQLYLTTEQREKIVEAISAKWQPAWEKWTEIASINGANYLPTIPDPLITPHLNAEQKSVWKTLPKQSEMNFWFHNNQGQDPDSDGWWGPDPVDEKEGEAKPAALGVPLLKEGILEFVR